MCGICGVYNHPDAARIAARMGHAQNHRGEDSAGIAFSLDDLIHVKSGMGLVSEVLRDEISSGIPGSLSAMVQNRYPTTGSSKKNNAHPILTYINGSPVAIAHNGNIPNALDLKKKIGGTYSTDTDTEVILALMAESRLKTTEDQLSWALQFVDPSYSLLLITPEKMIAARDPVNNRPLSIGRKDGGFLIASEDSPINSVGGTYVRDVLKGEMVVFENLSSRDKKVFESNVQFKCAMCDIYFASPTSQLFNQVYLEGYRGRIISKSRYKLGEETALMDKGLVIDHVVGVPDSGVIHADGYLHGLNKLNNTDATLVKAIIRSHYSTRTFIASTSRREKVNLKFGYNNDLIEGKRLAIVDDSLIRGTTVEVLIENLYIRGAKEVHFRSTSPLYKDICEWGIDTPRHNDLLAAKYAHLDAETAEQKIRKDINERVVSKILERGKEYYSSPKIESARKSEFIFSRFENFESFKSYVLENDPLTSLKFLKIDGMRKVFGRDFNDYCWHCFGGPKIPTIKEMIIDGRIKYVG